MFGSKRDTFNLEVRDIIQQMGLGDIMSASAFAPHNSQIEQARISGFYASEAALMQAYSFVGVVAARDVDKGRSAYKTVRDIHRIWSANGTIRDEMTDGFDSIIRQACPNLV